MAEPYTQRLEIKIESQPDNAFAVFRMSGREAISELFRFEVEMLSDDADIALDGLAGKGATLTISRLGQSRTIHGMVERIELRAATMQGQYVYRVVVVPRLKRLALSRQNQIHGTTTPVSVSDVLAHELIGDDLKGSAASAVSGRLGLNDFELRLTQSYPKRDYVVQFNESDFDFISRLCEHYGIFYFFIHENGRDVAVFGDSRVAFPTIAGDSSIAYRTASGLANTAASGVFRFVGSSNLLPARVCLRDYNYRIPNLALEIDETVDANGHGVVVEFGAHFRTPQEGRDLARVRAQELAARKFVFEGSSDNVHMTAGAVFDLDDHFRNDFNASYLVTWIEHESSQALPGISEFTGPDHETSYRNRFECLPKNVDFRPARKTPKPRMTGLTNATVDASGAGQRAEIDASGRYKIRQQFDQRGEAGGQSSHFIRKTEPYGGANTGMHFPLLKGTEIILGYVNGDPDRPIIVGAMQNEQYPSVVNSRSNTKNRMRTTSGALFEVDDGPASGGSGGSGASLGAALEPQRALEGLIGAAEVSPTVGPVSQPLARQRAEADAQTSGGASSSFARLHTPSGTDSYWRQGSKPTDTTEDSRTPGMSDMTGGDDAGGAGLFEYTAGDGTSLVDGSSYIQVGGDRLDYVVGNRRMSAAVHNAVAKGEYGVISNGLSLEASAASPTDNASPTDAGAGNLLITSANNLTEVVGGSYSQEIAGNGITRTEGTEVSQTWGSTADFMMGSSISMTLGFDLSINLSAAIDITAGGKFEMFLGISCDIRIGPAFEFASSPAVDLGTVGVSATAASVDTTGAEVTTVGVKSENSLATVASNLVESVTRTLSVTSGISIDI